MQIKIKYLAIATLFFSTPSVILAADLTKAYDMPDATKMIEKDLFPEAKTYVMPKSCNLNDPKAIARGKYMFDNLNGKKAKKPAPEGLVKFVEKKGKDGIVFLVKDYGVGIENVEKIFSRYYRENEAKGGFGIGLNIVKQIIDEENILLDVVSEVDKGTTFQYTFLLDSKNL